MPWRGGFPNAVLMDFNHPVLPFADGTFRGIACAATLEHVFYPGELPAEIARVLSDDGTALISLPNDKGLSSLMTHCPSVSFVAYCTAAA